MKKYIIGSAIGLLLLGSMGAFKQSPTQLGELATVQELWTTLGTITASQTTFAVGERDYATVDALSVTKTVTFEPQIWANDIELRFQTTADADEHIVQMWVARGRTDHYDLAAILTLTGGKQEADGAYFFVDTIDAVNTSGTTGTVIHSASDSIARYVTNLSGYSKVVFIATTLQGSSTLTIQSALQSNASKYNVTIDNASGTSAVEIQMTSPVKTSAVAVTDAWQVVTAATTVVGNACDFSGAYGDSVFYIDAAQIEATAHAGGAGIKVQTSPDGRNWSDYSPSKANPTELNLTADTAVTTTTAGIVTADVNSIVDLTDGTTGDFDTQGSPWFIKDGTIANSEIVFCKSNATNAITIMNAVQKTHASGLSVYDRVDQFTVNIREGVHWARVVYKNADSDCDIAVRAYPSMTTAR